MPDYFMQTIPAMITITMLNWIGIGRIVSEELRQKVSIVVNTQALKSETL